MQLENSLSGEPGGTTWPPGLRIVGFQRRVTLAFRILADAVEIVAIAYAGRDFTAEVSDDE